jgi:hypothetical protein
MPFFVNASFASFLTRLLVVDMLLLIAHTLCTHVLVASVIPPVDYLLRTIGLAWILHKHVATCIAKRDTELRQFVVALNARIQTLETE